MTFDDWWNTYLYLGDDLDKELAKEAFEAGAESVVNSKLTPDHIANVRKMIPEGYVLVPVEPTEKMLKAVYEIDMEVKYDSRGNYLHSESTSVRRYKAMLKAAQEVE